MTKTLLSMPKRTMARLKVLAQRRRTTVSHLMREAVEKSYGIDAGLSGEFDWREDPLMKFFETLGDPLDGGPADSAKNHDKYILKKLSKKMGRDR